MFNVAIPRHHGNGMTDFITIAPAAISDMVYIDYLQRKNSEQLSFYPLSVLEREVENQRLILASVNNEPAGYLYHGSVAAKTLRIHQACIQYDLRGYAYGAALVRWIVEIGNVSGSNEIALRCGSDIAANGFWQAMGFECVNVSNGGARRMRDINAWRLPLTDKLFAITTEPSTKKKSAKAWTNARKAGITIAGSSFSRGSALTEYRKTIEANERITQ